MRRLLFLFLIAPVLFAGSPRLTFERKLPAPHDLGKAEEIALVHAPDGETTDVFVEDFVHQVNRSGSLRMRDLRRGTGPADVYLDVKSLSCETAQRQGEGSMHDADGSRVKRKQEWIEALCMARVDVLANDMRRVSTFYAKGDGTSSHVEHVADDERTQALLDAARLAAVDAATRITPRRVRETISLADDAPSFEEGMAMIDTGRVADARAIWERALRATPRSAPLHFNLAAVCEALGDRKAAEAHYVAARELAPGETRYSSELKLFARRTN